MDPEDVRQDWAERSGQYSPEYYAEIGPNEVSETLVQVLTHYINSEAAILELGCGSGRHLAHIYDHGFENLTGIDINEESFDVMAEYYPEVATTGTFHTDSLENFVTDIATDAFDVVFSVETLQHIHPDDEWVFESIGRITGDLLITAENEGNSPDRGRTNDATSYVNDEFPLYHRDWKAVFTDVGFAQLLCEPTARDTIRVFRMP